jgi:GT2 family glycosyltransferase
LRLLHVKNSGWNQESVVSDAESHTKPARFAVSIIIPSHCPAIDCEGVLNAIGCQSLLPEELILVRVVASLEGNNYWSAWDEFFERKGVNLKVVDGGSVLFPGAARNLGLHHATRKWVALLDVETVPCERWLEEQIGRIEGSNSLGCFGSTIYTACSFKQALVRDAIYGRRPIQTLPGSVLRKDLFSLVGQFIPNIRAAEDTEWIIRAKAMGVKIRDSSCETFVYYTGLTKLGLRGLAKKWRRNYLSSRQLQHLKVQTTIVWLVGYFFISLGAFNWNAIVAGWQIDSPFYIDHVTKVVSLTPIALYVVFRGCYLPYKRGVPWSAILPFRFLLLAAVGAQLDSVKVTTIFLHRERQMSHAG